MEEDTVKFEGELEKYSGVGVFKHKTKIWMILDELSITLFKFDKRSSCIGSINVYDIQISRTTGHKSGHEFEINTNSKSYTFSASSKDLATQWVKHIQKAMSFRITPSSSISYNPERGRNRREETKPPPDIPEYEKTNIFGVNLKSSKRNINIKSASTATSDTGSDKPTPELKRSFSVPSNETDNDKANSQPISSRVGTKVKQLESLKPDTVIKEKLSSPPPFSPVREETGVAYLNTKAKSSKDKGSITESSETNKVLNDENSNTASSNELKHEEQMKGSNDKVSSVGEKMTTSNRDKNAVTTLSDTYTKDEHSDEVTQIEMRHPDIRHLDGSPVILRKSYKNHDASSNQISSLTGDLECDSLYDDIAFKPEYPTQDSSDDGSEDVDDAVVRAFDAVFEERDESKPEAKPNFVNGKIGVTNGNAFTRLKEYLENNCDFQLESHTVTQDQPIETLRNYLIK